MGTTIAEMARRFGRVDLTQMTKEIIVNNASNVEDLNRSQLYKGLDSDGNFLSPKYSEDPFFKTREAAARYAQWKKDITPDPDRPLDVPNLYITGRYHRSKSVIIDGDKIGFRSDDPNAAKINAKFKKIDGLTNESVQVFRKETLYPELVKQISQNTGAGIRK